MESMLYAVTWYYTEIQVQHESHKTFFAFLHKHAISSSSILAISIEGWNALVSEITYLQIYSGYLILYSIIIFPYDITIHQTSKD